MKKEIFPIVQCTYCDTEKSAPEIVDDTFWSYLSRALAIVVQPNVQYKR